MTRPAISAIAAAALALLVASPSFAQRGGGHAGGGGGMHGGGGGGFHGGGMHGGGGMRGGGGWHGSGGWHGGDHHGGWHGGHHGGADFFFGVGPGWWDPWWYGYPYYGYGYPYYGYGYGYGYPYGGYYPPPVAQSEPPVYVEPGDERRDEPRASERYWYYCPSSKKYYPNVGTCREEWLRVAPRDEE